MKIETVNVADLKPLERNVRRHGEPQIEAFVKSLDQFGQTRPFVIDEDNRVLVGNGMLLAMQRRGDGTASAYRLTGLSDREKKKLVITDNKMYSLGYDDFAVVEDMLREITLEGDFDIAGFEVESLKLLVAEPEQLQDVGLQYGSLANAGAGYSGGAEQAAVSQGQAQGPAYQPASTQPAETSASGASPQAEQYRTVICPSCGEVIRL